MVDLKQVNEALNFYIRPQTFPLAIRMCQSSAELPEKVRIPNRDLGITVPVCQGVGMARRYGWTVAVGIEDISCPFGALTLGFVPLSPGFLDGSYMEMVGLGGGQTAEGSPLSLEYLDYGEYTHALIAPIHRADFEPHFALIYGNPAQVLRLVQGRLASLGGTLNPTVPLGAACSVIFARTMISGECQFVLSCHGDRMFGMTQDHEVALTIPVDMLEGTVQGLEAGHRSGAHRYPIPSFLRSQMELPPAYNKLMEMLREEK